MKPQKAGVSEAIVTIRDIPTHGVQRPTRQSIFCASDGSLRSAPRHTVCDAVCFLKPEDCAKGEDYRRKIYDAALNNFARLSMSAALASPMTK